MNDDAVCRTALATPGLLKTISICIFESLIDLLYFLKALNGFYRVFFVLFIRKKILILMH